MSFVLYIGSKQVQLFDAKGSPKLVLTLPKTLTAEEQLAQLKQAVRKRPISLLFNAGQITCSPDTGNTSGILRKYPANLQKQHYTAIYNNQRYDIEVPEQWHGLCKLIKAQLAIKSVMITPLLLPYSPTLAKQFKNIPFNKRNILVHSQHRFSYFQNGEFLFSRTVPKTNDLSQELNDTLYYCKHHYDGLDKIEATELNITPEYLVVLFVKNRRKLPAFFTTTNSQNTLKRKNIAVVFAGFLALWAFILWPAYSGYQKLNDTTKRLEQQQRLQRNFLQNTFPDAPNQQRAFYKQVLIDTLHNRQLNYLDLFETLQIFPENKLLLRQLNITRSEDLNGFTFADKTFNDAKIYEGKAVVISNNEPDLTTSKLPEGFVIEQQNSRENSWGNITTQLNAAGNALGSGQEITIPFNGQQLNAEILPITPEDQPLLENTQKSKGEAL